ncbi:M16 family metallopeptidase [Botrimarina hoheduenensis]|uniref:M16 family metallopeptidase n=1 Tax=Botrimarina hoheduenensis TaxID=2528000 RepID=UPI0011B392DE|nr:pitrilysin family protein [Botrimarina hoheduenensis]
MSHRLANGLTVIGEPSDAFESAAFTLLTPSGCRYDPDDRLGLASLTCEMMLRGAGSRDSRALVNDLDAMGVEHTETVGISHATFSASSLADSLEPALALYADVVRRPHLPADQLEQGRQVCLQEVYGVEDEPSQKLMNELRRQHYPSPWGRASCGDEAGLNAVTQDEILAFQASHYGPEGSILAVAGRFDWQELLRVAERLFGDWAPTPLTRTPPNRSTTGSRHLPFEGSQCHIGIAYPSVAYRDPEYFQAWSAVGVLSSGMSSRLFTEVREKRGLCYTVYASLQSQVDRAAVLCYAGTTAERAQETLDVTYAELIRLAEGVTVEELGRLKARIKSALILQQESTASRAGTLARDWRHLGRVRSMVEVGELIDAVTADTINAYLAKNPPRDFTMVTLGPEPLRLK